MPTATTPLPALADFPSTIGSASLAISRSQGYGALRSDDPRAVAFIARDVAPVLVFPNGVMVKIKGAWYNLTPAILDLFD